MTNPTPTRADVEALATKIARDVAELPDRASPPDEPMLLLVTEWELIDIVQHRLDEAYAATLPPQAGPVVEDKPTPTPEMRDFLAEAQKIWCDCGSPKCSCRVSEPARRLVPRIAAALADAAQKAALEAEARVAEMREACITAIEACREYDGRGLPAIQKLEYSHQFAANRARDNAIAVIRALPSPSSDRFMRLLEAMQELYDMPVRSRLMTGFAHGALTRKEYEDAWLTVKAIVREALFLFPQPEEKP